MTFGVAGANTHLARYSQTALDQFPETLVHDVSFGLHLRPLFFRMNVFRLLEHSCIAIPYPTSIQLSVPTVMLILFYFWGWGARMTQTSGLHLESRNVG
jgi:hypothetical protein